MQPLSRLTYAAYLVHPIVQFWYIQNLKVPLFMSDITMVCTQLLIEHCVYLFSYPSFLCVRYSEVWYLLFYPPVSVLWGVIWGSFGQNTNATVVVQEDSICITLWLYIYFKFHVVIINFPYVLFRLIRNIQFCIRWQESNPRLPWNCFWRLPGISVFLSLLMLLCLSSIM